MTIDEAIDRQSDILIDGFDPDDSKDCDAIRLGIEALNVFRKLPPMFRVEPFGLLPGETEE